MAIPEHQRSPSNEAHSSNGSAYQLIFDHILSYPGSYEIPLRTMYTLNSAPRAQPTHSGHHSPSSSNGSPVTPQGPFQDDKATRTFNDNLMAQISQLPNQPASLPPSFITSFVRRCFPPELVLVDFPQALTGLDYLKDLEIRRRREVASAMNRLDISSETLTSTDDTFAQRYPGVAQWVKTIETKERKIDALYTQLYVGLRRWIIINELSLLPYNKHNCYAMLNTLYPPVISNQPTSKLTPAILKGQRDGFIKYIQSVEKSGPRILGTLMQQGKAAADDNGWIAVTRTLGLYLQLANSIIHECMEINDVQSMEPVPTPPRDAKGERQPRKVDSGVSFNVSEAGNSNTSSNNSRTNSVVDAAVPTNEPERPITSKPLPPRPEAAGRPISPTGSIKTVVTVRTRATSTARHGSALERLARGLRSIGRSRTDATEMIIDAYPTATAPAPEKARTLRKMRSMGTLEMRAASKADLLKNTSREAGVVTAQKYGIKQSHEI